MPFGNDAQRLRNYLAKTDLGAAPNYEASKAWALAGFRGWPDPKVATPPGDRPGCACTCELSFPHYDVPTTYHPSLYRLGAHWYWVKRPLIGSDEVIDQSIYVDGKP